MTTEQQLARMLVVALHQLGGAMEVSQELLDHMGSYNIVWEPRADTLAVKVSVRAGELLIAHVDNDVATVVL